jgi:replication factor C small subunit
MSILDSIWVEKYRPQKFCDLILDKETKVFFEKYIKDGIIPHILLCGIKGTGKTTLAKIVVKELDVTYLYLNASDKRKIDDVRDIIIPFVERKSIDGKIKIVILDEMDGLTADAQRALRNIMEEYSNQARFILTANHFNMIADTIRSRAIHFNLMPPIEDIMPRIVDILVKEKINVPDDQKKILRKLIDKCYPDIRSMINFLQKFTISGALNITKEAERLLIAKQLLDKIMRKDTPENIRKFLIEDEVEFMSDYHLLMKNLFEVVFDTASVPESKKAASLVTIGEYMYKHQFVMDYEINAFCCILQLQKIMM